MSRTRCSQSLTTKTSATGTCSGCCQGSRRLLPSRPWICPAVWVSQQGDYSHSPCRRQRSKSWFKQRWSRCGRRCIRWRNGDARRQQRCNGQHEDGEQEGEVRQGGKGSDTGCRYDTHLSATLLRGTLCHHVNNYTSQFYYLLTYIQCDEGKKA